MEKDLVILLHGLIRTRWSMRKLASSLSLAGYEVFNCAYPSRTRTIEELSEWVFAKIAPRIRRGNGAKKIHFVTHSMGGILVRQMAENHPSLPLGRVVMLAPPNQGSELVDALKNNPIFKLLNGPAGAQLGTDEQSVPINLLRTPRFECGIIAGNRSFNPLFSKIIGSENDGKVAVKRTKLPGVKNFLLLPVNHTFIIRNPAVIRQTIHFLQHGRFAETRPQKL